jgi:hypothetical protein
MICMCALEYSCFGKNPLTRSWLTTRLSRWGCYKDLLEWLLFNPSSSEGRSLALSRISGTSSVISFMDAVKGKGKGKVLTDIKGKAPLDLVDPSAPPPEVGPTRCLVSQVSSISGGFMVDARCASQPHAVSLHPVA